MEQNYPWMIYGSTGRSGELIARKAVAHGLRPILASRDEVAVRKLAEELNLPWRAYEINDWEKLRRELSKVNLFVNAAGPLMQTSVLVAESCLAAYTHYFDLTNQIPSLTAIYTLDAEAKEKDVTLLPGLALSPAASNCLVDHLHRVLPDADSVDIALNPFTRNNVPGANLTVMENFVQGGFRRRGGRLERYRTVGELTQASLPTGKHGLLPSALGDVEATYRSTKLPNIMTYIVVDFPSSGSIVQLGNAAGANADGHPAFEHGAPDAPEQSLVWARLSKGGQSLLEGWIQFGEAHEFTAAAMIAGVIRLMTQKKLFAGALTPAAALGPDFILELPNVKRTVKPLERRANLVTRRKDPSKRP